jgi:hypothetical protein
MPLKQKKGKVKAKLLLWVNTAGTPGCPNNKRPDRPQSQSGLSKKRKIFPFFQESNQGSLVIQSVF